MGVCARCIHYRRVKPASQLLAAALENTTAEEVAGALTKVVDDEQKQRDSEAEFKSAQATAERDLWLARPVMSDYCGLSEAEEVFLIAEVKNLGGRCENFAEGKPERRACGDCAHRVPASGWERDRALDQEYTTMVAAGISAQTSTQTPEALLQNHRKGAAARQGFELSGAYSAKGVLAVMPEYLDHCAHFSSEDAFVVCVLQNPYATCAAWTRDASAPETVAPAAVVAPPRAVTPDGPAPATDQPGPAAPPSADEVLVAGPPALTRTMVSDLVAFTEWMLQVTLPQTTRDLFEVVVLSHWREGHMTEMGVIQQWLSSWKDVVGQEPAMRDFTRESNQGTFVASMRGDDDELSRALLSLYDTENAPIAPGSPPLTQEASDASLDLFDFMSTVVNGVDTIETTPAVRVEWTARLVEVFPTLPPEVQAWFAEAPMTVAALRAGWNQMTDEQREAHRRQWVEELPLILEFAGGSIPAAAPSATVTAREPVASPVAEERSTMSLLDDIIAAQQKEEEELMKTNPELALQKRLYHQQMNTQMMSNMSKMMHETSMAIINNIK